MRALFQKTNFFWKKQAKKHKLTTSDPTSKFASRPFI